MPGPSTATRIIHLLRVLSPAERQNRLMRVNDRDLALAMLYMSDTERRSLCEGLSAQKELRTRQELERFEHTRMERALYDASAAVVLRALQGGATTGPKSYFRPTGRSTRR